MENSTCINESTYTNEIANITDKVIELIKSEIPDESQNINLSKLEQITNGAITSAIETSAEAIISNGVYISLSKKTEDIIKNDIELFRNNIKAANNGYKYTFNKFINNVFLNMYNYERTLKYNDKQSITVNNQQPTKTKGKKIGHNIKMSQDIIKTALNSIIPKIKIDYKTIDIEGIKKHGIFLYVFRDIDQDYEKNRLKTENNTVNIYAEFDHTDIAKNYVEYIEKYASLSTYDRRRIFYREIYNDVQKAINLKHDIDISMNESNKTGKKKSYHVIPHRILKCDDNDFDYIAAFALKDNKYSNLVNIPVHKIIKVEDGTGISFKDIDFRSSDKIQNYKDMLEYMEYRLTTDGILYLCKEPQEVTVYLTQNGYEMTHSRSQYKPYNITFKDNDSSDTKYVKIAKFNATQLQTFLFFFKFGKEAYIAKPDEYRDDFINKYREALKEYETNADKDKSTNNI